MKTIKLFIMSLFLTSCSGKNMFDFNPYTTIVKQIYLEHKKGFNEKD